MSLIADTKPLRRPDQAGQRAAALAGKLESVRATARRQQRELTATQEYLGISSAVAEALEKLSEEMFGRITKLLEEHLTQALQEVLEQPLELKVVRDYKNNRATIEFHIERDGHQEDILKGQGGSVANVLSVGLRFFALKTLDENSHRRFLVLDEQDCWLRPDLVPRLVKIVSLAGRSLGFQVLMISHHDVPLFQQYADKIYRLEPDQDGVKPVVVFANAKSPDEN
jgi:ABC-type glutathione transport system ATPase component